MSALRRRKGASHLDEYCMQLGLLMERRYTEQALVTAKEQAEDAATLANQAMRQAQEADRAKTQFLATVTHELRTPLNSIIGFSEIIRAAPGKAGEIPTYAQYIHESGTQLLTVLNGVLDLARLEARQVRLDEDIVPLEEVLRTALRVHSGAAMKKLISIVHGHGIDCVVRCDPAKLVQALGNLLSNAIKFTPQGGSIEIGAELGPQGELVIYVKDSGCGIASEDLDRVLHPFNQSADHLTRQGDGLGIGLPIAQALVKMHDGEIVLASEVDIGTTAEIRLPAVRLESFETADAV